MTETKDIGVPSKWIPMADPIKLAGLGKLTEECGELTKIIGRCICQGMLGADPATGKINRTALLEELADVQALTQTVLKYVVKLAPDEAKQLIERSDRKMKMKDAWLEMLK